MNDVNELREAILDKVRCLFRSSEAPSIDEALEALSGVHDDLLQSLYQALDSAFEKDRKPVPPPIAILPDEPTPFVEGDQAFEDKIGRINPSDIKINIIQPTEGRYDHSQND